MITQLLGGTMAIDIKKTRLSTIVWAYIYINLLFVESHSIVLLFSDLPMLIASEVAVFLGFY